MSLPSCIPDLIETGRIRKGDGAKATRAYGRHYRRLEQSMSAEAAAAEASELTLRELDFDRRQTARQTFLQIQARQRIAADMATYEGGDGFKAAAAVLASDAKAPYRNVEAQQRAVLGRIHARMGEVLARHRRNLAGETRDKSGLADLVRERFGEKTGNTSAAELSEAFGDAAEYARRRFNRAGGTIGKRQDWGLPQSHDSAKVRAVSYEQWRGDILPRLDLDRMIDDATGLPFTPDSIEDALRSAYDAIRSDGWSRREAGGMGIGKLANRRSDHRFFAFRSADDWLAYNDAYGAGNAFDAMVSHADAMAREIGLMEVMGPNPAATLRWMQDSLVQQAQTGKVDAPTRTQQVLGTGNVLDRARSAEKRLGDLYDAVSGQLNSPVNEVWARRMGGTRAILTSALLGSAAITALSDVAFQAITRGFNRLPVMGAITGYLKLLNPLNRADRRLAVRLGLIAEEAAKMAASLNRYVDGTHGPEIAMRLADAVLRVSGLSPWTQAGRWAFGMQTLGHLADMRGSSWNGLDRGFRDMLARYGIDEAGWDKLRATEPYRHRGAEFLRPDDVEDEGLGDALLRMVLTETDYAVPAANARSRATLSFGQRPGTLGGEIQRNAILFKSFGVAMVLNHGVRMMQGTPWNRAAYAVGLFLTTGLLGYLADSLSEISRGREPRDPGELKTWGRALLKGGGFGIFGDFLDAGTNRFGGGFAETLSGPVVGFAGDVTRSAYAIGADALDPNRDANPGREADRLLSRYLPGGSIWYSRLAFERLVLDQLQREIDPDYDLSWQRMEDAAARQGQDYWWRPGELAPDRLPGVAESP